MYSVHIILIFVELTRGLDWVIVGEILVIKSEVQCKICKFPLLGTFSGFLLHVEDMLFFFVLFGSGGRGGVEGGDVGGYSACKYKEKK